MGLPNVNIIFQNAANAAIQQGSVGILALVIKDASISSGVTEYELNTTDDIPGTLSTSNQDYIKEAFIGMPAKIKVIAIPNSASDYSEAETYLETIAFNVLAIPGIADVDVDGVVTWAKSCRDTKDKKFLFVAPNNAADHESIINFTTDNITVDGSTFTANRYCGRIAGMIAGLPLTIAPTFQVLPDIDDVPHITKGQADTAIDAGELVLYHDGEKVKIARGVTSLTTLTNKSSDWQKIKIVRILDKIYSDLKSTIEDNYIGRVSNSYQNKLLLMAAVRNYFEILERQGILEPGFNKCDIDMEAQKIYLLGIGIDISALNDQQVKEYNTRDKVFLTSTVRPIDAIEDVQMKINL